MVSEIIQILTKIIENQPFVFLLPPKVSTKESQANHDARSDIQKSNSSRMPRGDFSAGSVIDAHCHFHPDGGDRCQSKKAARWKELPAASRRQLDSLSEEKASEY